MNLPVLLTDEELGISVDTSAFFTQNPEICADIIKILIPFIFKNPWTVTEAPNEYQFPYPQEIVPFRSTGISFNNTKVMETIIMRLICGPDYYPIDAWCKNQTNSHDVKKTITWWQTFPGWAQAMTEDLITHLKVEAFGLPKEEMIS
jgi:hypothetical protein